MGTETMIFFKEELKRLSCRDPDGHIHGSAQVRNNRPKATRMLFLWPISEPWPQGKDFSLCAWDGFYTLAQHMNPCGLTVLT